MVIFSIFQLLFLLLLLFQHSHSGCPFVGIFTFIALNSMDMCVCVLFSFNRRILDQKMSFVVFSHFFACQMLFV